MAASILLFRAADGFSRNMLFANQIDLFQRYGQLGGNSAQRAAKFLNAVSSVTPLAAALVTSRCAQQLQLIVALGSLTEIAGLLLVAAAVVLATPQDMNDGVVLGFTASDLKALGGGGPLGRELLFLGFFGAFALGFGLVASSLPVLASASMTRSERPRFMQLFFAFLTAGSVLGTSSAAFAQASGYYVRGLLIAAGVLSIGTCTLVLGARQEVGAERGSTKCGALKAVQMLPLLTMLPFYACYCQWTTSWYVQTEFLDRRLGGTEIPPAMLQVLERIFTLFWLFSLPRLWLPLRRRLEHAKEQNTPLLDKSPATNDKISAQLPSEDCRVAWQFVRARLAAGSAVAGLAMVSSSVIEVLRRDFVPRIPGSTEVSSLSVIWLLPQFALIAASEALIYPAITEFTSSSTILSGISLAVQAVAAAGLGVLLGQLEVWIPNTTPNDGHYDYYFMVLGLLSFTASIVIYTLPIRSWID